MPQQDSIRCGPSTPRPRYPIRARARSAPPSPGGASHLRGDASISHETYGFWRTDTTCRHTNRDLRERGVVLTTEAPYVPDDSGDAVACRRDRLRFALTQIHAADSGTTLSATSLAELAITLEDIKIRDCLYALSTGPRRGACMAAWTQLVRALPAPGRTQAAMMLAVTAYTDDDAALATAAIAIAVTDEPGQQTALGLAAAFACSVTPNLIRASMRGGYTIAAELGIDLD
ncbi:DUF4192 family protein [Nocardia nepalensis]|uniref:DUF4192 family protein n=1 Tax=Nocardia nepalensis TaxID=3375448 RepID=UPI003B675AAF